jgi:hypothetical protein
LVSLRGTLFNQKFKASEKDSDGKIAYIDSNLIKYTNWFTCQVNKVFFNKGANTSTVSALFNAIDNLKSTNNGEKAKDSQIFLARGICDNRNLQITGASCMIF